MLEQRKREDQIKIEWLRAAAREGFDAIDRGEYISLRSSEELEMFMNEIAEEVSAKLEADHNRG